MPYESLGSIRNVPEILDFLLLTVGFVASNLEE